MSTDASKGRDELLMSILTAPEDMIRQGWQKEYCSWRTEILKVSGLNKYYASVAQLVERRIENPCVAGSIPVLGTN